MKKLALHKETLRLLTDEHLRPVAAGLLDDDGGGNGLIKQVSGKSTCANATCAWGCSFQAGV